MVLNLNVSICYVYIHINNFDGRTISDVIRLILVNQIKSFKAYLGAWNFKIFFNHGEDEYHKN